MQGLRSFVPPALTSKAVQQTLAQVCVCVCVCAFVCARELGDWGILLVFGCVSEIFA